MLRVGQRVHYRDPDSKEMKRATFVGYYMDLGCQRAVLNPHDQPEHELIMVNDDEVEEDWNYRSKS